MALRRGLRSCAAPLAPRAAPAALAYLRAFRTDATRAATATAPDAGAGAEAIASRRVSFAEPSGSPPPPPRRVVLGVDGAVATEETAVPSGGATLSVAQAVAAVKAGAKGKFDETIDIAVRLGVDPKRSDMIVRGAANLPHGTGKTVRVCVFAEGEHADEARAAGADVVGGRSSSTRSKPGARAP